MHPALNWEIKSVINFSHFYTLCWTKVERENYISIYVSQYRQLGHIKSFFFFIARPGPNCKRHIWLLRIFTLFSNKYSSQEMSLCLLLSFIWQSRLLRNQILFPLISPAGKLSKADSKAKTSSIHPTSHCGEARNKSFENHEKNLINFMQGLKSELHDNQPLFHESLFLKNIHMGQLLQGGKNSRLMSYFF